MVNLTALQNITAFELNTSIINDSNQIIPNLISNTNSLSNGWFGLLVMIAAFIYITWEVFRDDGLFRLDIIRSIVVSSGITTCLGMIAIISALITSYQHVLWFGVIFALSLLGAYILKQKGQ